MEITRKPFKHLGTNPQVRGANALGGKYCLPAEFDRNKFASRYVEESEVDSAKQDEQILGTPHTAPGWNTWIYPSELSGVGKGKHPRAGQTHRVAEDNGKKYVLMYRSKELQEEVNQAYAEVGQKYLSDQVQGRTTHLAPNEEKGIIKDPNALKDENEPD